MIKRVLFIGVLLAIVSILVIVDSSQIMYNKNPLETYKTLDKLAENTNFKFSIPNGLASEKNLIYSSLNGQLVEIYNEEISFKAAQFINEKADVSGDYSIYKIDNKYKVIGDTQIKYLRVRSNSDNLDEMAQALVSYSTDKTAYSIKFNRNISFKEILEYLGLTKENLTEYNSTNKANKGNYKLLGHRIQFPEVKSKLLIKEYNNRALIIIGNEVIMIIGNDLSKTDTSNTKYIELEDNYKMVYMLDNKFKKGTIEYNDYNLILSQIENISDSFSK